MTIKSENIKLLKSQVLLDTDDGGGAMTGVEVIDGQSNNLFPDISDLDRTYGRIALRKAFATVLTPDTDSYFGAHAIISSPPEDPKVSVTLFSTNNWFDRRAAVKDRLERYLARGPIWAGHLLEMQLEGQRAIQIAVRPQDEEPKVGQGLALVQNEGKSDEYEQYVRVTKVSSKERIFTVNGKDVVRKVVTIEISDPLRYNFEGISVPDYEQGGKPKAICRDTRVANAAVYYGISKLTEAGKVNDASLQVSSIFTQLVPSASSETPMVDLYPNASTQVFVPGRTGKISVSLGYFNPSSGGGASKNIYLGGPILPGSLTLTHGGNVIVTEGGKLILEATRQEIGRVEWDKGLAVFDINLYSQSAYLSAEFTPAGAIHRVADTASIAIVQDNRGYNFVITLLPVPTPGSLVVSYVSQGKVYYLHDVGGQLKGSDPAFGTGQIDYVSGSVILTCGALPDADTSILFAWGKKVNTRERTDISVEPCYYDFKVKQKNIAPSSLKIRWNDGTQRLATDDGKGNITGHAKGKVRYGSGEIRLILNNLARKGMEFTIEYQHGEPKTQTFPMPTRTGGGKIRVNLPPNIKPGTLELQWNVDIAYSDKIGEVFATSTIIHVPVNPIDPIATAFDNGTGSLLKDGIESMDATINYNSGLLEFLPDYKVRIPLPKLENQKIGSTTIPGAVIGGLQQNTVIDTFRRVMTMQYVDTFATMPIGPEGYVICKFRLEGGDDTVTETHAIENVYFDLTPGFAETIVRNSTRFRLGNYTYIDRDGLLYHSVDAFTGAGTEAGTLNYSSGKAEVKSWIDGVNNAVILESLVTESNFDVVDTMIFRIPISPVRPGSVQIRAVPLEGDGTVKTVTLDTSGRVSSNGFVGKVDYLHGVVELRFGHERQVTDQIRQKPWFQQEAVYSRNGQQYIVEPAPVYPDTVKFNAVAYTYLPLSADVLGLDPVRLPSDGRVPIFRPADVVVVHNTQRKAFPGSPSSGTTLNVDRTRLSYIKVVDSKRKEVPETMYATDLSAGTVTLGTHFNPAGFTPPFYAEHRIEDMAVVTDVQINGRLAINKPLTHAYPANSSYVSSALLIKDMQARAHTIFSQASWTNEWADVRKGGGIIAQYNTIQYPFKITNEGSMEERWAIIFTSSTAFRVVGENLGQIAEGNINSELSPINPATNKPYFTIQPQGWGGGWSAGNVLRFNTAGANFPLWMVRTVLQGNATTENDGFQLQIRGDIDR